MSINDKKISDLKTLGYTGGFNDMELAWLTALGYTTGSLQDRWIAYLEGEGYTGSLNDMLMAWLAAKGYSGSLTDRVIAALEADDFYSVGYMASATKFDGTNDYMSISGLAAADAKVGITSFWVNPAAIGSGMIVFSSSGAAFELSIQTDGSIRVTAENSAGTKILDYKNTNQLMSADTWYHVLATWDLANSVREIYISDTAANIFQDTLTNDTIDYTRASNYVGANEFGAAKINACLSDVYFTNEYLDITVESNRRKFIDASGKPVDLGADGSTPTGTQPLIYLPNPFGTFEQNAGSGGNFTVTGALEACASSPSD